LENNTEIDDTLLEIQNIDNIDLPIKEKFELLSELLVEKINLFLLPEKKYFANTYAKLIHIYELLDFPNDYQKSLNRLYFYIKREDKPTQNFFQAYKFLVYELVGKMFSHSYTAGENIELFGIEKDKSIVKDSDYLSLKVFFGKWLKVNEFSAFDSELNNYSVEVKDKEKFSINLFTKNSYLNLIDFELVGDNKLVSNKNSLIVLEPDNLISVTDIATCFQTSGISPLLYIVGRLTAFETGYKLILGNLVNSVFDDLITGKTEDFDEIFSNSLKHKVLSLFSLSINERSSAKTIKYELMKHYDNLIEIIGEMNMELPSIEPSFISIEHGMQGRLDLLLEYKSDEKRKEIVELKSGNSPNINYFVHEEGKRYKTGIWYNHIAQANAYNMLLDANYDGRKGDSSLLYSNTKTQPLRNVVNIIDTKRKIINTRNEIVHIENCLAENDYSALNNLYKIDTVLPDFIQKKISKIKANIDSLNPIKKKYFSTYLSFQFREILSAKVGVYSSNSERSFSGVWNNEAKSKFISIKNINIELSDLSNMYLYLEIELSVNHNFRIGDMVVLSQDNSSKNFFSGQLFKGVIKQITKSFMILSLRNKMLDINVFNKRDNWRVFQDSADSLMYSNLPFILGFLNSRLANLIVENEKPKFDLKKYNNTNLNKYQIEVVEKAISLKDYFLIVGPPGTGKTSYVLRSIVEYYFTQTSETILIAAYTNRAVDEICSALKKSEVGTNFLRLGSKESTVHSDVLISALCEIQELKQVRKRLEKTKIIVATVSSLVKNIEIFEIKNFDTLILDEASQIPELDSIAVISKAKKFIMIGDERQLPAIYSQKDEYFKVDDELLNSVGINDLSQSLFSRLKEKLINQKGEYAIGKLKKQARMHSEIMDLSNKLFYKGELEIFDKSKQNSDFHLPHKSSSKLEEIVKKHRIIFINTPVCGYNKYNADEVNLCQKITKYLISNYINEGENDSMDILNNKIGIISPFRLQCSELKNAINNEHVSIDTVERYQGSEREHIIISLSVNNERQLENIQSLALIEDEMVDRKLNVAISRAKEQLIILGNKDVLEKSSLYSKLIKLVEDGGGYYDYDEIFV